MRFRYRGVDSGGKPISGEMDAASVEDVTARLESDGLKVDSVNPIVESDERNPRDKAQRLSREEFGELSGHIAELTQASLPLAPGLMALAEEMPHGRYRRALTRMVERLEAGIDLATVLESHDAPSDLRAVIRAGVRSGNIGELLAQYISHSRNVEMLKKRTLLGLGYPALLLVATAVILGFFLVWLIPQFKHIFLDFGVELPWLTVAVIRLSDLLVKYGIWMLILTIPVCWGGWLLSKWLLGDVLLRRIICFIPVFGPLLRWSALSRFSHLLAVLLESEVPLPEALTLAGDAASDAEIQAACRALARDVENGQPLSEAARAVSGFPATFVHTLTWEKHEKAFPEALHAVADMFGGRARIQTSFIANLFPPAIVIFIGCALGLVVIGMFMPLIKLLNDLS